MFEEHPKKQPYKAHRPTAFSTGQVRVGVGLKRGAEKYRIKPGQTTVADTEKVHDEMYVPRHQVMTLDEI